MRVPSPLLLVGSLLWLGCHDAVAPNPPRPPDVSQTVIPFRRSGSLTPATGDRLLIDTRTSLQAAGSMGDAGALFGVSSLGQYWAFTSNVDGQGTNGLRIDWPRSRSCRQESTRVTAVFDSAPSR